MEISNYKINLYLDKNLIEVVYDNGVKGYKLTPYGKKIIAKMYGLKRSYTFRSIAHCSKLQEIYINLDLNKYKWITESEALDLLKNKIHLSKDNYNDKINFKNISPVDALIYDYETKVLYGLEVISKSYREKDLEKKYKFLQLLDIEAIFIEV